LKISGLTPPIALRDVEVEIKYLMWKNFNRGQGPARAGLMS
jgi:hypothetical protein